MQTLAVLENRRMAGYGRLRLDRGREARPLTRRDNLMSIRHESFETTHTSTTCTRQDDSQILLFSSGRSASFATSKLPLVLIIVPSPDLTVFL